MRRRLMPAAVALIGLFILAAAPLQAKDRGRGQGHRKWVAADRQGQTIIHVNDGWSLRRDRRNVVIILPRIDLDGRSGRPPGWDRGRKVGWGHCDLPPGLAKKAGCYDRIYHRWVIRAPRHRRHGGVVISIPFVGYVRLR